MIRTSLETELYAGRFDDGLLDLLVGVGVVGAGLAWAWDYFVFVGAMPAVLIPLWIALRRSVSEPRLGRVEFSVERRRDERFRLSATVAAGVGALVLAAVAAWFVRLTGEPRETLAMLSPLLPAFLLALGLVIVSALVGARRFVAYALLLGAVAVATTWLGGEPWLYLVVAGGLLSLWAATLFTRFLSAHPDLERE